MSCAVNNATSGGGKVLSVARLEMVKYRTKGSKWSSLEDNYLATLRGRSTNDSQKLSQKLQSETRARRWNVREMPFPKLVRAEKLVCERSRETQISDEAKPRTLLESLPDAFFRSRKEDMCG